MRERETLFNIFIRQISCWLSFDERRLLNMSSYELQKSIQVIHHICSLTAWVTVDFSRWTEKSTTKPHASRSRCNHFPSPVTAHSHWFESMEHLSRFLSCPRNICQTCQSSKQRHRLSWSNTRLKTNNASFDFFSLRLGVVVFVPFLFDFLSLSPLSSELVDCIVIRDISPVPSEFLRWERELWAKLIDRLIFSCLSPSPTLSYLKAERCDTRRWWTTRFSKGRLYVSW